MVSAVSRRAPQRLLAGGIVPIRPAASFFPRHVLNEGRRWPLGCRLAVTTPTGVGRFLSWCGRAPLPVRTQRPSRPCLFRKRPCATASKVRATYLAVRCSNKKSKKIERCRTSLHWHVERAVHAALAGNPAHPPPLRPPLPRSLPPSTGSPLASRQSWPPVAPAPPAQANRASPRRRGRRPRRSPPRGVPPETHSAP